MQNNKIKGNGMKMQDSYGLVYSALANTIQPLRGLKANRVSDPKQILVDIRYS